MITNIFLISRTSGICILHKSYSSKKQDESIISGYLTALNDFSQEIGGQTKELKMQNSRLLYEFVDDETLFVFVVEEIQDTMNLINETIKKVISQFKKAYPKGLNFTGDTDKYRSIGTDILDRIIYPLALKTGDLNKIIEGRFNSIKAQRSSSLTANKPFDLDNLNL